MNKIRLALVLLSVMAMALSLVIMARPGNIAACIVLLLSQGVFLGVGIGDVCRKRIYPGDAMGLTVGVLIYASLGFMFCIMKLMMLVLS